MFPREVLFSIDSAKTVLACLFFENFRSSVRLERSQLSLPIYTEGLVLKFTGHSTLPFITVIAHRLDPNQ
jgi:hypothetical protein